MTEHERRQTSPTPARASRPRARKQRPVENEDTPWRLFIAVPLPEEVRDLVARIIDDLRLKDWPVRWIDSENGHLTLHFIGDMPPESATLMRMALHDIIAPHEQIDLRTADLGAFPRMKNPRVLWLGLWGPAHKLESLYNDLGDFLDEFGCEIEDRPFHPHITLGRVRSMDRADIPAFSDALHATFADLAERGLGSPKRPIAFPVHEVQLIRSHLSHEGSQYEVLERYPLKHDPSS